MPTELNRILITGALGQVGTELTHELRRRYGADNVIATDLREVDSDHPMAMGGPHDRLDVTDRQAFQSMIRRHNVDTVFHLAAILSANGEQSPRKCWDVNIGGVQNLLEAADELELSRVIVPSSIAVFGPEAPKERTPQATYLSPRTMYGITKVTGELLAAYAVEKQGVDVRGLRFPGLISAETPPGGGTTDYAVDMYVQAAKTGSYTCFVREDTTLPMMYMEDAIRATIELAEADRSRLVNPVAYNVAAMSFSAGQQAAEIQRHIPKFTCRFEPDYRQDIADSWPRSIDDSPAREEWDWKPRFDLETMSRDMLAKLGAL